MHSVLRISEAASLAIHAAACLAGDAGRSWTTEEIAHRLHASENHLSKVLQRLAKAGLVQSHRGPGGGFRLAKDPSDIRLLAVYQAIEGALPQGHCLLGRQVCGNGACILGSFLGDVKEQLRDRLAGTRLSDLAGFCPKEGTHA